MFWVLGWGGHTRIPRPRGWAHLGRAAQAGGCPNQSPAPEVPPAPAQPRRCKPNQRTTTTSEAPDSSRGTQPGGGKTLTERSAGSEQTNNPLSPAPCSAGSSLPAPPGPGSVPVQSGDPTASPAPVRDHFQNSLPQQLEAAGTFPSFLPLFPSPRRSCGTHRAEPPGRPRRAPPPSFQHRPPPHPPVRGTPSPQPPVPCYSDNNPAGRGKWGRRRAGSPRPWGRRGKT